MPAPDHATWLVRLGAFGRPPAARKATKPPEITYGVDDRPPAAVCFLSALQQASSIAVSLVVPLVICGEARVPPAVTASIISLSFLGLAVAAVLQSLPRGPVGSGFLALSNVSALFIGPSVAALAAGGLPLMYGMTVFAGLLEVLFALLLRNVRPFLPAEVAGIVTFLVGIGSGLVGLREVLAVHAVAPVATAH